jgi:2-dehydro-3-deoxyphosphogluconate aldolase / (4S)-4-hydroxy-2-oxoglutarate aldolase
VTSDVLDRIAAQRVLPILRTADAEDAVATARACARAGMGVVELTTSIPDVESALRELSADDLVLGLGTVTRSEEVPPAVAAGARFVVSFAVRDRVVEAAASLGVVAIPGALTPTEVLRCLHAGAPAVKLFPARLIEPAYLTDLLAMMPGLRALVTGGVPASAEGIGPWLDAGALAVGLGSSLGTVSEHGADEVERRARAVLQAVAGAPA